MLSYHLGMFELTNAAAVVVSVSNKMKILADLEDARVELHAARAEVSVRRPGTTKMTRMGRVISAQSAYDWALWQLDGGRVGAAT